MDVTNRQYALDLDAKDPLAKFRDEFIINDPAICYLDGNSKSIKQGEEVIIKKAEFMINVIKFEDNNFLDTIRNKMMWGLDTRN